MLFSSLFFKDFPNATTHHLSCCPPATLQQEKERTTRSGPSLAPHSKQFMLKDKDRKSIVKFAELVVRVHDSLSCEVAH